MKRVLFAALLLLSPLSVSAQVDHKFVNFQSTVIDDIFTTVTTTLMFRNAAGYAQPASYINAYFRIEVSNGASIYCFRPVDNCNFNATPTYDIGPVDRSTIAFGNSIWKNFGGFYSDVGCQEFCYGQTMAHRFGMGVGVFGCNVPPTNTPAHREYVARTCDADGFTGWLATDLHFSYYHQGKPPVTVDDFQASFNTTEFATVVPEPGTYVLMVLGLLAVGLVRRRRT